MNPTVNYPIKVLQFGEGNFLRCFADWIIDSMNKQNRFNGSVAVVQPIREGKVDILNKQDGKYNIFLRGIKDGKETSERYLVESVVIGINPYTQYDEFINTIENPDLRFIISNTTEAGIVYEPDDSIEFKPPKSFPGKLTALLYHRFKVFKGDNKKGFILFPCELIDNNADKLKEIVLQLSEKWKLGSDFKNWILNSNYFCNTLVDRIVPGYPVEIAFQIAHEIGYEDKLLVEGEIFHLWVIKAPSWISDEFPAPKAGLNVLFVNDVTPYKIRKVRILNGAHTIMTPVSYLSGIDTVKETIENPVLGNFIRKAIYEEIIPTIDLPIKELKDFSEEVISRFKNPFIKHYLLSISLNSISKFETRVLPSMLSYFEKTKKLPERIVFSFACLLLFYRGLRNNISFELKDDPKVLSYFSENWIKVDSGKITLEKFVNDILKKTDFWKKDISGIEGLSEKLCGYIKAVQTKGILSVIEKLS